MKLRVRPREAWEPGDEIDVLALEARLRELGLSDTNENDDAD